jgi:hypothetical protein
LPPPDVHPQVATHAAITFAMLARRWRRRHATATPSANSKNGARVCSCRGARETVQLELSLALEVVADVPPRASFPPPL